MQAGDKVYALNPKYRDGTRLRQGPSDAAAFNGKWVPNDTFLTVLGIEGEYANVQKADQDSGWIRLRNIRPAADARSPGVTKDVITNELVTPDPEYVKGMKIYGCGIKEDPVCLSKIFFFFQNSLFPPSFESSPHPPFRFPELNLEKGFSIWFLHNG